MRDIILLSTEIIESVELIYPNDITCVVNGNTQRTICQPPVQEVHAEARTVPV